jgi:hypothetical protein
MKIRENLVSGIEVERFKRIVYRHLAHCNFKNELRKKFSYVLDVRMIIQKRFRFEFVLLIKSNAINRH